MDEPWAIIYVIAQILYFFTFMVMLYFLTRKVNWVDSSRIDFIPEEQMPLIVLAYPVLREDEDTMHTTMVSLSRMDYPKSKYKIIAIPNSDDTATIEILKRLQSEFPFLEIMEVPPTTDPSWNVVWQAWEDNPKAYWFHLGKTEGNRNLPPKKTRQLIYLFYTLTSRIGTNWVLDYIDADSITPANHFKLAAVGLRQYDVLQAQNIVGNPLDTWATTFHAFDHMCWDGNTYPHMTADGKHPYYVLGKGLFYKAKDLFDLGCFNPWITIEDPEIGMRLWTNGKRLGIIEEPLIEEVPQTFRGGIIQRNRWMCGFFQSLNSPLEHMGMKFWHRQMARLNFVPTLSLLVNLIGVPTGAYALYLFIASHGPFPAWVVMLSLINILLYIVVMGQAYWNAWKRTRLVLHTRSARAWYMFRVNPLFLFLYYILWAVPIFTGLGMFLSDRGKAWARTEKVDADRRFVSNDTTNSTSARKHYKSVPKKPNDDYEPPKSKLDAEPRLGDYKPPTNKSDTGPKLDDYKPPTNELIAETKLEDFKPPTSMLAIETKLEDLKPQTGELTAKPELEPLSVEEYLQKMEHRDTKEDGIDEQKNVSRRDTVPSPTGARSIVDKMAGGIEYGLDKLGDALIFPFDLIARAITGISRIAKGKPKGKS